MKGVLVEVEPADEPFGGFALGTPPPCVSARLVTGARVLVDARYIPDVETRVMSGAYSLCGVPPLAVIAEVAHGDCVESGTFCWRGKTGPD